MNGYVIGTRLTLNGLFTDPAGAPIAPTTVEAKIMQPDGVILDLTGGVTTPTTGTYVVDFTPTQEGLHTYRFQGTGACVAADEQTFTTRTAF